MVPSTISMSFINETQRLRIFLGQELKKLELLTPNPIFSSVDMRILKSVMKGKRLRRF